MSYEVKDLVATKLGWVDPTKHGITHLILAFSDFPIEK